MKIAFPTFYLTLLITGLLPVFVSSNSFADSDCTDSLDCKSSWLQLNANDNKHVFRYGDDYKNFLDLARTELSFVAEAKKMARLAGFEALQTDSPMTAGARYYAINRDRTIALMVIGETPMTEGVRVVGAHIDSPRLELKARPVYEKEGFALFQTQFHGGIKTYQWTNLPLELTGRVDRKDGSTVYLNLGMNDDDPIFIIPDMSPHTDRGYSNKKVSDQVKHEELDPIAGQRPIATDKDVADQVLAFLKSEHGITRADLVSAELALTPALKSRDVGFDRALIAAYGQDDRLGAYAALRAVMELEKPAQTAIAYLVDNEEVGNVNNTGAKSTFFTTLIASLMSAQNSSTYEELALRRALAASEMISIDVNPGINPKNPAGYEKSNGPKLGYGVNLKMYGQGFSANSEFTARIRRLLDDAAIPWQTTTYKVGQRGGGTIGGEFSRLDMEVIDFGVPVLSIHTPMSISSKVDVYHLYRACTEFLGNAR